MFAVAFTVFSIGLPLLGKPFSTYPSMTMADVLDIFTPLVLLPLYWLLHRLSQKRPVNLTGIIVFFISYAITTLFFVGWGAWWQGFPEFSGLGII